MQDSEKSLEEIIKEQEGAGKIRPEEERRKEDGSRDWAESDTVGPQSPEEIQKKQDREARAQKELEEARKKLKGKIEIDPNAEVPGNEEEEFGFNAAGEVVSGPEDPETRETLEFDIESIQGLIKEEQEDEEEGLPGLLEDIDDEFEEGRITEEERDAKKQKTTRSSQERIAEWQAQIETAEEKLRKIAEGI